MSIFFGFLCILIVGVNCVDTRPTVDYLSPNVIDGFDVLSPQPFITVGESVEVGRYPWYAVIFVEKANRQTVMCGSVLVTPIEVLTAAHCVENANSVTGYFHLGDGHVSSWKYTPSFEALPEHITMHPLYNPYSFFGDIAVIKLNKRITQIFPVVLSSDLDEWENSDTHMGVIGHGMTENDEISSDLRMIQIPVVKYNDCVSYSVDSRKTWLPMHVHDDLCAGFTDGCLEDYCPDACHGDSGGPIFDPGSETVYGLVSRGESPCGQSYRPVMFTSMYRYRKFIDSRTEGSVTWNSQRDNKTSNYDFFDYSEPVHHHSGSFKAVQFDVLISIIIAVILTR